MAENKFVPHTTEDESLAKLKSLIAKTVIVSNKLIAKEENLYYARELMNINESLVDAFSKMYTLKEICK